MRTRRDEVYARPAFWNEKAKSYTGTAVSMFINRVLNDFYQRDQFSLIDECLGPIGGKRVADIGCGTGRLSRHLAKRGAHVVGYDFSEESIELARRESADMTIDYRVGSIFDIEEVEQYDAVIALASLTVACRTTQDFDQVIANLARALKPGGQLLVIEPFHRGFLRRVLRMSGAEARQAIQRAGFVVNTVRKLHFWPTRLVLTLGETPAWITRVLYPIGEFVLRLTPRWLGLADYTAINATAVEGAGRA